MWAQTPIKKLLKNPVFREKETHMEEPPPLIVFLRKGIAELCEATNDIDTLDLIYKLLLEFSPKSAPQI